MKRTIASLAALGCLILAPVTSNAAESENAAAQQLVELIDPMSMIADTSAAVFEPILANLRSQGIAEEKVTQVKEALDEFMQNIASDPTLEAKIVDLYASLFSESEMEELIEFYKSPTGKELLAKTPDLQARSLQLGQSVAAKYQAQLQTKVTEILSAE